MTDSSIPNPKHDPSTDWEPRYQAPDGSTHPIGELVDGQLVCAGLPLKTRPPGRRIVTQCMQLSTSVYRWPDEMLEKAIRPPDGATLDDVRAEMRRMEAEGIEVFDCGRHRCDEKGRCTGEPVLRLDREKLK